MLVQEQHSPAGVTLLSAGPLRVPVETRLRHEVAALLRRGVRRIEVSLAAIADVDAAGVGELVRIYNMATAANGTLRVVHINRRVRDLLAVVGLLELLSADAGSDITIS